MDIQKHRIGEDGGADTTPEKIVYVELDDELTRVVERVVKLKQQRIALVIPRQALILQSIINLKILKKKLDAAGKTALIVTTDSTGLQNARTIGFKAIEKLIALKNKKEKQRPLMQGERPVRSKANRVSIAQVIQSPSNSRIALLLASVRERWRKRRKENSSTRIVFSAPNKQALFSLILVSVFLFVGIAYIALPGATIYITPRATLHDPSFNVTFLDFETHKNFFESGGSNAINVPSYPVNPPAFTKKITHSATGKISTGSNARGIISIYNLTGNPWDLAAKTRFQTETGVVFRTPKAVRIPPARSGKAGVLEVEVIADTFDSDNQIIGTRGNIGPSKFFLPGLKNDENRQNLFGESKAAMVGGSTSAVKAITKDDIAAAIEVIKTAINKEAADESKKYLEEQNIQNKTNLSLLSDKNVLSISEPQISVPTDLEGKQVEQFEITATYTIKTIAFNRQDMISALRERLLARSDPEKRVVEISENDLSYKYLDADSASGKVRLTVTMRALQIYELDPESETGKRFLKKVTDHILGARIETAREYLQQQTDEIAGVDITTWPIWAPTIPSISDNIKFVIRDQESLQ